MDTLVFGEFPVFEQVVISYDKDGDPTTMVPNPVGNAQFSETVFFGYDSHKRLKDFITAYKGVAIVFWQRYTYPAPRVVVDTFYNYDGPGIPFGPNPPPGAPISVSKYISDDRGRTIESIYGLDTFFTKYDQRGDVVIPGAVYDDKVNIYRTNPVWQLIFQDYNMNNQIEAPNIGTPEWITSYNTLGLPLVYMTTELTVVPSLFLYPSDYFAPLRISYNCDCERQSQTTTSH